MQMHHYQRKESNMPALLPAGVSIAIPGIVVLVIVVLLVLWLVF
jgi:hypothetical protein